MIHLVLPKVLIFHIDTDTSWYGSIRNETHCVITERFLITSIDNHRRECRALIDSPKTTVDKPVDQFGGSLRLQAYARLTWCQCNTGTTQHPTRACVPFTFQRRCIHSVSSGCFFKNCATFAGTAHFIFELLTAVLSHKYWGVLTSSQPRTKVYRDCINESVANLVNVLPI